MDTVISNDEPAPNFILPDLEGRLHSLEDYRGRVVVLNFWSAECPWSRRVDRQLGPYLPGWGDAVVLLPIACNADEPRELLRRAARERGLPLVLYDERGSVADRYGAQTTPHFFVIDPQGILRYQGAFDDTTFRQREPSKLYIPRAVEAVRGGRRPDPAQTAAYGCALVRHAPE